MDSPQSIAAMVIYVCWGCGGDFEVSERDGFTDDLEVACPACGSDLVAGDIRARSRRLSSASGLCAGTSAA
jgi:DNA-directed RNA polymerase subunit RPC12/RpoP